jgi:hypothetical protein
MSALAQGAQEGLSLMDVSETYVLGRLNRYGCQRREVGVGVGACAKSGRNARWAELTQ